MGKNFTDFDRTVAARIRIARTIAGISQEKAANKIGVTWQQLQKYEKGANRISAGKLKILADTFGKPVAWFFGDTVDKPGTDIVSQMLTAPYGAELAQDYLAISNQDRRVVADVARALANGEQALKNQRKAEAA